jgi:LysR family transcriptional regulator, nod-box dependent transcriptional activator
MHLAGLDLNLLVVLDALFSEKSVTRAGERIHLSQSATSAALGRLRQFFGDELLVPVGHTMLLTPQAQELEEHVRDFILRADAITKKKTVFEPSTAARHFRLMMTDCPATVLMPHALADIQKEAPGLTFEILSLPKAPAENMEHGEVDLLIMPRQWISSRHPSEDLFHDSCVCVVWSENRLVKKRISLDQYLKLGHVGIQFPGENLPALEEWFFAQVGRKKCTEVVATTFTLMAYMVVRTTRVATLQSWLAREFAKVLPIRIVASPIEIPQLAESMQWHQCRESDPGIIWLRNALKAAVLKYQPKIRRRNAAA